MNILAYYLCVSRHSSPYYHDSDWNRLSLGSQCFATNVEDTGMHRNWPNEGLQNAYPTGQALIRLTAIMADEFSPRQSLIFLSESEIVAFHGALFILCCHYMWHTCWAFTIQFLPVPVTLPWTVTIQLIPHRLHLLFTETQISAFHSTTVLGTS